MDPTLIRDLFQIPKEIRPMDFTVVVADGVARPAEIINKYRVTESLARAYTQALALIGACLRDGRSEAVYLHGSFGAGKSHFMALLSLLLRGDPNAWALPELKPLRPEWVDPERPVAQLHLHMLDQESFEAAIFGAYLDLVREHHPDAPLPALFADAPLFADAAELLNNVGDAAFFAPLNPQTPQGRWGTLAAASSGQWDRARFDAARNSPDLTERAALLTALTRTHFKAFANDRRRFVELDPGLQALTLHAKQLGYVGVVLFLDELILWLSMNGNRPDFVSAWVGKMVKLVQGDHHARHVPLISFIARQRDLANMIGHELAGPDNARLQQILELARGRFGTINLEDDNLPAIVEKRVLIPRSPAAASAVDAAFTTIERAAGHAWNTLLGSGHDRTAFRQVYPFSPVLIDALIVLSQLLQRQRTAIHLLSELLAHHLDGVLLGELVGIGDLFDALIFGTEPYDPIHKARFQAARELYQRELAPRLRTTHATDNAEKCQRIREGARQDIGCSGCPQKACRNDNRLIKTLILAALIPELPAFRELTVRRLVELNHGQIRSVIPGREAKDAYDRLRRIATHVGQITFGRQSDPTVSILLEGVDTRSILAKARDNITSGVCQQFLGEMLFEALELGEKTHTVVETKKEWHRTWRHGAVVFGNVRRMGSEQLRCPDHHDWRIIIDYPFDEQHFGPLDDIQALEKFISEGSGSWTLVWLPSFFSRESMDNLEDIIAIRRVLDQPRDYLQHLSVDQQESARTLLANLENQKRAQLTLTLQRAYGLAAPRPEDRDLDASRRVEQSLRVLRPATRLAAAVFTASFDNAIETYVHALLETRYPRHPHLTARFTRTTSDKVVRLFGDICDAPEHKLLLSRDDLDDLRATLGPLGFVRFTEGAAHLVTDGPLQAIERRREQVSEDNPTVGQIHTWFDERRAIGLQPEALAVVVRCYARVFARTLVSGGRPLEINGGSALPAEAVLEKPALPSAHAWTRALALAGHLFGLPNRKALTPENLKVFETALTDKLNPLTKAALELPDALGDWLATLGLPVDGARLTTALCGRQLLQTLQGKSIIQQIEVLAEFTAQTSPQALGTSLASGPAALQALRAPLLRGTFEQLVLHQNELVLAPALLSELANLLTNENKNALADQLHQLAERANRLNLQATENARSTRNSAQGGAGPTVVPGSDHRSEDYSAQREANPSQPDSPTAASETVLLNRSERTTSLAEVDELLAAIRAMTTDAGPLLWQIRIIREDGK